MNKESAKQTAAISMEERLNRMGAHCLSRTPGAGETLSAIFQGMGILAQEDYLPWYLENVLGPKLEKLLRRKDGCFEDLIYQAMDLAENIDKTRSCATAKERRDGYELLYELLIAPFCYLERLREARAGQEDPFADFSDEFDDEDWFF